MKLQQIGNYLLSMVFAVPTIAHKESRDAINHLIGEITAESNALTFKTQMLVQPSTNNFGQGVCEYYRSCPFRSEVPMRYRRKLLGDH